MHWERCTGNDALGTINATENDDAQFNRCRNSMRSFTIANCLLVIALAASTSFAQNAYNQLPEVAEGVEVDPQFGAQLPLRLRFRDEQNRYVTLKKYFDGRRPVLLSFNYSNCPKLCSVQLRNLAEAMQDIRLKPGRDFELVIVSLDPNEQAAAARELKQTYLTAYGDMETETGWHVLIGDQDSVKSLATTVGFHYKYIPRQKIYSHPAAFIFCSGRGKVVRYLDGLDGNLRFSVDKALMEASRGKVGTVVDKFMYFSSCYVYDQVHGKYSFTLMSIMRWAGFLTVGFLLIWLVPVWVRSRNLKREPPSGIDGGSPGEESEMQTPVSLNS